jgi:hypothetical protein
MVAQIKPYKDGFRAYVNDTPVSRKPVDLGRASQQKHALLSGFKERQIREYALGDGDVHRIIPTLNIVSYPELLNYDDIHDVLDEKGRLLILYPVSSATHGHWICLLKQKRNGKEYIEFFDPYGGYKPDEEKQWVDIDKQRAFGQDTNHLTELLRNSGMKVTYNRCPFQSEKKNVNTCGRHCATRLYFKHLSLPQYTKMIQGCGMSPDDFVSSFTYAMIGK